jgi:hypothetical protein
MILLHKVDSLIGWVLQWDFMRCRFCTLRMSRVHTVVLISNAVRDCPSTSKCSTVSEVGGAASNSAYYGYPELWILRYPAQRYHAVPSPGFEPTILWLRVRRPNHWATTLHKWINPLRTDGDFCHQGWDTEIARNILRLSTPTTWPFTGKLFLIVPLVVPFIQFSGNKCIFCIFLKKNSVRKELLSDRNLSCG